MVPPQLLALVGEFAVRELPDFPGYAITADGRVLSYKHGTVRELYGTSHMGGYRRFNLTVDGQPCKMLLHRLVALAFLGEPPFPGALVRHLSGISTDSRASNLGWGTFQSNSDDARRHGRIANGSQIHQSKLSNEQVRAIRRELADGDSLRSIGCRYAVSSSAIWQISKRLTWYQLL